MNPLAASNVKPKPTTPASRWPLLEAGYQQTTVRAYRAAVKEFYDWCRDNGADDPKHFRQLDELLADYFQQMYDENEGKGKTKAKATLYGVYLFLPHAKGKLIVSERISSRWSKSAPATSYPPLTWELTVLVAVQMARHRRADLALAALLGFDCLLRVGELMRVRARDIAFPTDARMGAEYRVTTLAIPVAKTGRNQSVIVRNPDVVALLRDAVARAVAAKARDAPLFRGGAPGFRALFKRACAELGLSDKYVPHSLRHGGATRLHLQGVPLEDIMARGRWASAKSARTYIQASRAVLMATRPPPARVAAGLALSRDVKQSLALAQKH